MKPVNKYWESQPPLGNFHSCAGKREDKYIFFTPNYQLTFAYYITLELLFSFLDSAAASAPQRSVSLDRLLGQIRPSNDRTLTLEQLMAEMPFVGRGGNILKAVEIIESQFKYWAQLFKSGKTIQSLKNVANLCCTGPSGIGKTTFGQQLRVHLSKRNGNSPFDGATKYATRHNLLVRIGFDMRPLESEEFDKPERSLALRLMHALFENTASVMQEFPSYQDFQEAIHLFPFQWNLLRRIA